MLYILDENDRLTVGKKLVEMIEEMKKHIEPLALSSATAEEFLNFIAEMKVFSELVSS